MDAAQLNNYSIDIGPMGPIGEGESLILRVTRNCPWNRCLFCPVYKEQRFSYRSVPEIKSDIDAIKRIVDLIETTSWKLGFGGKLTGEILHEVVMSHPEIYGNDPYHGTQDN